jgi:CHAD domain-containing protein
MPIDRQRNEKLCRRLSRLLGQIGKKADAKAVHQFRTTARRVESMLDALSPEPDRNQRKLTKHLTRLRRRAGQIRNIDVQTALLRSLKIGADGQRKERILKELAGLRERREKRLIEAVDAASIKALRKRLDKAVERSAAAQDPDSFDPVTAALRDFVQVARTEGPPREETLHGYRLQTKRARYIAELAGANKEAKSIVAELKRMQDAIGEWHDWLQLTERAEKLLANGSEVPLISALKNVTHAKYRQAISIGAEGRKNLLELARTRLPARKESGSATNTVRAATA